MMRREDLKMLDINNIPDTLYFASSKKISELKDQVFLTPHIGIASLFIIDTNDLFPKGYEINCNLGYRQWDYPNNLLSEPLKHINVLHNIVSFKNKVFKGYSSGYIYEIDVNQVKENLSLFISNNSDREVIYNGDNALNIIQCIPHTVQWDFTFSEYEVNKHGIGTAEKNIF